MTLTVPDVSEFQGAIDWNKLATAAPAVIVRAHNGWRMDNYWQLNAAGAARAQWWAAYQYLPASVDPVTARHEFETLVDPMHPHAVILDLEEGTGDQSSRADAWLAAGSGAEWVYSGLFFMRTHLSHMAAGVHRWIAAYQATEPSDAHVMWQYTDKQSFPGIAHPCDASVFHGTVADLLSLTDPGVDMPLTSADLPILKEAITDPTVLAAIAKEVWAYYMPEGLNVPTLVARIYDIANGTTPGAGSTLSPAEVQAIADAVIADLKAHPLSPQ